MVSSIYPESFLGLAMLPKPFIGIIHTYHMFNIPIFDRWPYFQHTHNLLNNFILNKVFNGPNKKLIAVSEFAKSQLLKSFIIPSDTFSLIYNFGIKSFNNSCKRTKDNKFRILTLGHVREYKNPFLWIKVAEKVIHSLPEKEIEFIWGGNGELLEDCKQTVMGSELENKIRFTGHVGDVAEYYSTASMYFQPSLIESHGIAVVEAMAYSLPCVVANIGGLPESVEHGFNGYIVPPYDIDEMSKAIISIITNPRLCIELGENSLQVYKKKFSFEIWKAKMDSLHINIQSSSNYRK
jgi:glycosyltransferase involved in cell wall biosynthesis